MILYKGDLKSHFDGSRKKLNLKHPIVLFKIPSNAITTGTFFFAVYMTTAALEKLDKNEQFALIDHELLDFIIDLKIKSEFGADKISAYLGNAKTMISALKKAIKGQSSSRILKLVYVIYFSNRPFYPSVEERIRKLEEYIK